MAGIPAIRHLSDKQVLLETQKSGHGDPMEPLKDCVARLPIGHRPGVYPKVFRQLPLSPAHLPPLLPEAGSQGLRGGLFRVIAEEFHNAVQRKNVGWLPVSLFPVADRELGDFQDLRDLFLGEAELQPTLPNMVPDGLGLKVSVLSSQ